MEMNEKIHSLQGLVRNVSLSTHRDEYDREALLKEVAELQGRIGLLESRESKARATSKLLGRVWSPYVRNVTLITNRVTLSAQSKRRGRMSSGNPSKAARIC